ncbi:MAG: Gfo/Idh/MocA family oxidoreductase [Melioribacteraceae bacterium]|nr:Gfo/Idh/MocA family oxidoreductase [Melioribacteraceae bacterium]MCF8265643.1 Gfo/Idh/MocA family oxidoreductase [Melioribacteraceae bacterium]MCF8414274.1 Gfo/Idh/MocA family oxidoreductase [Melioribacteraceae bacterium]
MDKIRIGVIGLGGIAQVVHLPILSKLANVEITAVSELNKNRLNTLSSKFDIKNSFTDYRKMLDSTDLGLDAVVISTPTNTHHDIAIDVIDSGKHLLIEKPVTRTYEEANSICQKAEAKGVKAMVAMNMRFRPDAMLLKSLINSKELGEVFYIKCSWLRKASSEESWFSKRSKSGGGVIIDLGISLIDLSIWLLGYPEFESVSVQKFNHKTKSVEDSAVGMMRFKGDAVVSFETSWTLHSEEDTFRLTAYGTKGTAHLNPLRAYHRSESGKIDYTNARTSNLKNLFMKSYENELKHFIGSVVNNTTPISSCKDALSRMQMLENIYQSAEEKREIHFK